MRTRRTRPGRRLRALTAWTLGVAALGLPAAARAQAVSIGVDTNVPQGARYPDHEFSPTHFPFAVQWQTRSLLDHPGNGAFGFSFRHAGIHLRDRTDPSWSPEFSLNTFQWTYDRALLRRGRWLVTAGLDAGLAFYSEDWDSGNPDAAQWFPAPCWALSPELQVVLDTGLPLDFFAAVRRTEYVTEDHDIYPFDDGFAITVGLHLHP